MEKDETITRLVKHIDRLKRERDDLLKGLKGLQGLFREAYVAYREPGKRQDERARAALKILGFTTGKRQASVDRKALFWEYVNLISGSPDVNDITTWKNPPAPHSKEVAIATIAKKYNTTPAAISQHLKLFGINQRRKLKAAGLPSHGWDNLFSEKSARPKSKS